MTTTNCEIIWLRAMVTKTKLNWSSMNMGF